MCFVYKHIHFTYIRGSPSKRGFPYTVQFVHQTGGVGIRPISNFTTLIQYIYRSKTKRYLYQKSLPDFSRYIPIIGDLPLPRFHGPTPLIFFTMSAMRSAAHTRLEPVGLVDTLDSRRAASSLRSHFTSPSPSARMSPPQQQWRRLPNN